MAGVGWLQATGEMTTTLWFWRLLIAIQYAEGSQAKLLIAVVFWELLIQPTLAWQWIIYR